MSTPSYDPASLTDANTAGEAWEKLTTDPDKPLTNRAAPAAAAGLDVQAGRGGRRAGGRAVRLGGREDRQPGPVHPAGHHDGPVNENERPCENATIRTGLQYSCNNVFAKMAVDLGQDKLRAMAEKFGFNDETQDVPVRAWTSVYPEDMDRSSTALTGIGQFDVTATPLQMAMVSAALANGGELVSPHMVSQVTDGGGDVLEDHSDADSERIVSSATAGQLQSAIRTVVDDGTGSTRRSPERRWAARQARPSTARTTAKTPYAWFTSYAKSDSSDKEVAVAVIVEQSDAARSG
ncbi:penicillin-binding transpeptidase domain-containing protein [Streptomyces sp. MNU103]|uniref:penicillin-binding transpeptidase domain-containing protein n=1 Tax=Streptomyces sp. MNU103 TaxID=2560024 RepID=UPI00307C7191